MPTQQAAVNPVTRENLQRLLDKLDPDPYTPHCIRSEVHLQKPGRHYVAAELTDLDFAESKLMALHLRIVIPQSDDPSREGCDVTVSVPEFLALLKALNNIGEQLMAADYTTEFSNKLFGYEG